MPQTPNDTNTDYKQRIISSTSTPDSFTRLTLTRKKADETTPWIKITVRPVLLRGQKELQFTYYDARQAITKNYPPEAAPAQIAEILALPFTHIHLQSPAGDLHIRITHKGKALVTSGKPSSAPAPAPLLHNRPKHYLLQTADPFLQAIGITDHNGNVRPPMQDKFRQINEFLRVVDQTVPAIAHPLHIVDCGCGSAYLTFAACRYLRSVRGLAVRMTGIDTNESVIAKCIALRESLGWTDIDFHVSTIRDFTPNSPPDVVLSLHACDLATDEAIARGILWNSGVILAAPCCQHELHEQLHVPLFHPLLRHGILKERLADLLTDTFRALVLRIMGYQASVIEFISPEHTPKNLMIRAEKIGASGESQFVREYEELKAYWDVTPAIEGLLGTAYPR